jgi:hypothetical protein
MVEAGTTPSRLSSVMAVKISVEFMVARSDIRLVASPPEE